MEAAAANESSPGPGEAGCGRHVARAPRLVHIDDVAPGLGVSRPRHRDLGLEGGRCKLASDGTIELSTKLCLLLVESAHSHLRIYLRHSSKQALYTVRVHLKLGCLSAKLIIAHLAKCLYGFFSMKVIQARTFAIFP